MEVGVVCVNVLGSDVCDGWASEGGIGCVDSGVVCCGSVDVGCVEAGW